MKAATLRKRRAARGRPREDCDREPNGRRSRSGAPAEDARAVGIEARMRHFGIPEDMASHEKAGSILGLLHLQGLISEPLREAGENLVEWHQSMIQAIQAPDTLASGGGGGGGDSSSPEYVEWATAAVARWEAGRAWLMKKGCWRVFHFTVLGRHYPGPDDTAVLRRGLAYVAARMGLDGAARV